jgi:hypothetical protein
MDLELWRESPQSRYDKEYSPAVYTFIDIARWGSMIDA